MDRYRNGFLGCTESCRTGDWGQNRSFLDTVWSPVEEDSQHEDYNEAGTVLAVQSKTLNLIPLNQHHDDSRQK